MSSVAILGTSDAKASARSPMFRPSTPSAPIGFPVTGPPSTTERAAATISTAAPKAVTSRHRCANQRAVNRSWLQTQERLTARWFAQRWRLVTAFGAAVLIVAAARSVVLGGPVTGKPIGALGVEGLNIGERALALASLVPRIATLLIWPTGVSPHYGPSAIPVNRAAMAAVGLLVVGIAVAIGAWLMRRGDRRVLAAVAVIMIAFLPASNLLVATGQVLAERTLYLSSVGAATAAGVLLERLAQYASQRASADAITRVGLVAVATLLLLAAANTTKWVGHW